MTGGSPPAAPTVALAARRLAGGGRRGGEPGVTRAVAVAGTTHAAGGGGAVWFLGIDLPSLSGILRSIADDLFSVLAGAFLPGWLRHAGLDTLRWLIALPDPADATQWPTMHRLEQDTTSVAVAFCRSRSRSAPRGTPPRRSQGQRRTPPGPQPPRGSGGRAFAVPVGVWERDRGGERHDGALLGFADVGQGLERAVGLLFAGGVAFGVTGALIGWLVIAAILLAVALFVMKVGIFALFALLYVAGPLTLAGYPVPELHGALRMWLALLAVVALVPLGWCLIFAVAGALSADVTHLSTPAAIGSRTVGFFAAILMFFIAFRWPFFLIAAVKNHGLFATAPPPPAAGRALAGRAEPGSRRGSRRASSR